MHFDAVDVELEGKKHTGWRHGKDVEDRGEPSPLSMSRGWMPMTLSPLSE